MQSDEQRSGKTVFPQWYRDIRAYQERSAQKAVVQLLNTIVPYGVFWALMVVMLRRGLPYWAVLAAVVPASLFLVRTFIIFHDCCHGSFLPSTRWNRILGYVTGVLTFTAYEPWRIEHLRHHATNGQLDHRGSGDVWTMTLEEYVAASRWTRLKYRVFRNPAIMFLLGPLFVFVIGNRLPGRTAGTRERRSVWATNLGLVVVAVGVSIVFGFGTYLAIQLPVILLAGTAGIWLFYVQHQFDPGYWARDAEWDRYTAAMSGASYYRLPPVLRWLTGNIGIHHIHHLRPAIPNYRLWEAYRSAPEAQTVQALGFLESLSAIRHNLWHESERRFLSFRQARLMVSHGA